MHKFKPEKDFKLCDIQEALIQIHLQECAICRDSLESYNSNYHIAQTPCCQAFLNGLQEHVEKCNICSKVNKEWNENAIPVSNEMRLITGRMVKGIATPE